jgi:NAD(P)H-hydrate epimerase
MPQSEVAMTPSSPDRGADGLPIALRPIRQLFDAEASREIDRRAGDRFGLAGIVLMRRAGAAVFDLLRRRWPDADSITVFCGRGNNAGDGYVVAGMAAARGLEVQLLQVTDAADLRGEAGQARDWAVGEGVVIESFDPAAGPEQIRGRVLVDALLGTGIRGAIRPQFVTAIEALTATGRPVLAVDLPSGLEADTGADLGADGDGAVRADATLTLISAKQGLFTGAGPGRVGDLHFADLGGPAELFAAADAPVGVPLLRLGEGGLVRPRRRRDAHKGRFGRVLVVGGEVGTGGAVVMAAESALRTGAGLVAAATRAEHLAPILARTPEVMVHPTAARSDLVPLLEPASVVVVGPGLGRQPWGEQMMDAVLAGERPLVVDADGLNLLAGRPERRDDWVLTPHPGEAARLLGVEPAEVEADRFAAVRALRERFGGAVVLKGAGTLVADADGVAVCPYGNPGMASGGMGDVLAGIIGGLVAQGLPVGAAARLGVCLHGAAADAAVERTGEAALVATDLMPGLARWLQRIRT